MNEYWDGSDALGDLKFSTPLIGSRPVEPEPRATQSRGVDASHPRVFVHHDVFAVEVSGSLPGAAEGGAQGVLELDGAELAGVSREHAQVIGTHRVGTARDHLL